MVLCCVFQLSFRDPVHTVNLRDYVMQELSKCRQQHGQPGFDHLMEMVDIEIRQQLQEFIER